MEQDDAGANAESGAESGAEPGAGSADDSDAGGVAGSDAAETGVFWLYDLQVETVVGDREVVCNHVEGPTFRVEGENLVFEADTKVSLYALSAILPLLPAKQRDTAEADWMTTDAEIACPDPHCGGRFRITRLGRRKFTHAETTGLPDHRGTPYWQKDNRSED